MSNVCSKTQLHQVLLKVMVFAVLSCVFLPSVHAKAVKQVKEQVPGFYRMMVGDLEVTALYDGQIEIDRKVLKNIQADAAQALLARMFLDSTLGMQTAVNGYLINTGKNLVLVDTGAAKCFSPDLGSLTRNIRAAGYKLAEVDTVLLTHLHPDHVCGLVQSNGKIAFPNAEVHVSKPEADFWLSEEVAARAPQEMQDFFKLSRASVAPYVAAGKFKTYTPGTTVVNGVVSESLFGHTPGHSGYLFTSKGQSLLVWGDIVHNYAIQLPNPEVAMEFDVDSKQAVTTRKNLLQRVANNKLWIAAAHLPFPGIGRIRTEQKGYSWVPVMYQPVK